MSDFKVVSVLNPTVVLTAGPVISAGTQSQNTGTIIFQNGGGVSFGLNNGTLTASAAGGGGAADGGNVLAAGTQTANSTGTVVFQNSNGVTFGMNNSSQITATVATNYMASNAGSNFVGLNSALTGNGVSMTVNSSGVSLNVPAFLTTAAQSNHSHNFATTTTNGSQIVVGTANSAGATIGVPAFITTYAAQTTQTQPAGNIAGVGTTFAGTNISGSMTVDTAGVNLALSVAAGGGAGDGYNSAQFTNSTANSTMPLVWAGNSNGSGNVTIGLTGSTITMSAPSGGGGGGGIALGAGTQTATSGTVAFANSNGITFGMSGSNQITASYTVPNVPAQTVQTQASGNIAGTGYTSTTQAGSTLGVTLGTNGLSLAHPPFITTYVNDLTSGRAGTGFTSTTTAGTAIVATQNTAGLSMGVPAFITTYAAQTNQTEASGNIAGVGTTFAGTNVSGSMTLNSAGLNLALSAGAGGGGADGVNIVQIGTTGTSGTSFSASTGTVFFNGSNNITVSQNNSNQIVISGPTLTQYLTTAALSNHSHNFATTTTNGSQIVVGTANSVGATIGVPAFITTYVNDLTSGRAGTGTTLGFSGGITGSMTLNTNGLNLALSELAGTDTWYATGANTIAGTATSGTFSNDGYVVSGAGGISVGVSSNTLVISGGGGTTNQTGPNIAVAGSTITSGTVVFANSNGVTFGLNGQTMTASAAGGGGGAATQSRWVGPANVFTTITSATATAMNNSLVFGNEYMPIPVSGTAIGLVHAHSVQSSYNVSQAVTMTVGVALYTKINDTQASLYTSGSSSFQITWSSSTTTGVMGGLREIYIPMNFTLPAGDFIIARRYSFATNTSNANSHTMSFYGAPHITGGAADGYGVNTSASVAPFLPWNGVYSATTSAFPDSIGRSQLNGNSGVHGHFYREYRGT